MRSFRKTVLTGAVISFVICGIGCALSCFFFRQNGHFPVAFRTYGGECMSESGFGMRAFHTYSMMQGQPDSVRLWFSPADFILWWAAGTILISLILAAVSAVFSRNR